MTKRKAIPKKIRDLVKAMFNGHCAYCGTIPEKLQVDHVIPHQQNSYQQRAKNFDVDSIENLLPSCAPCNNYKITYSLEEFRKMVGRQTELARKQSVNFRMAERFGLLEVKEFGNEFYFEKFRKTQIDKP